MRCSFFPGLASGLCTAKVIGLADSRESPDIYIHSRTDINPLRRHAHPAQTNSISGKIGARDHVSQNSMLARFIMLESGGVLILSLLALWIGLTSIRKVSTNCETWRERSNL